MLVLKSTMEKRIAAMKADFEGAKAAKNATIDDLRTERSFLRTQLSKVRAAQEKAENLIAEMQPIYDLGKRRRANYEADNARRKAKRAAK